VIAWLATLALAGCATTPAPLPTSHPAQASAPGGRLAGAPPALRPGVVEYKDVPKTRSEAPVDHSHHHK
jgi:hypothetical protein